MDTICLSDSFTTKLKKILKNHQKWLNNNGGKKADLQGANLQRADLQGANLQEADLRYADLREANLQEADLQEANLRYANLQKADLQGANLQRADLREANISNCKGLISANSWMNIYFKKCQDGYIVYKAFGNTYYFIPKYWKIEKGSIIKEVVSFYRTIDCGCGVNFATLKWIKKEYKDKKIEIWKCLLSWEVLADLVVPYNSDGKARCGELKLLKKIK